MVFSILATVVFVACLGGLIHRIRTSDRRIITVEENRERAFLRYTTGV